MKSCIIISVARSGTHMVMKLLNMMGLKEFKCYNGKIHVFSKLPEEGFYMFGDHVILNKEYLREIEGKKIIFITRDPRDIVVASHFATMKDKSQGVLPIKDKTTEERITAFIEGTSVLMGGLANIDHEFRSKLPWRNHEGVYPTTFEKIVGSRESREQEIKNIAKHLDLKLTDKILKDCVDNLVGSNELYSGQFRKGIIGDWKNYFTDDHKKLFKEVAGQLLIQEGYEKDLEW